MNNKGFTLIELIVTILLVAMISSIAFASINKAIQKSKEKECLNIKTSIRSAADLYFSDNRYNSEANNVTAQELKTQNYLNIKENYIENPINKEKIQLSDIRISNNTLGIEGVSGLNCS